MGKLALQFQALQAPVLQAPVLQAPVRQALALQVQAPQQQQPLQQQLQQLLHLVMAVTVSKRSPLILMKPQLTAQSSSPPPTTPASTPITRSVSGSSRLPVGSLTWCLTNSTSNQPTLVTRTTCKSADL